MSQSVCDNILATIYLIMWISTFVYVHYRWRRLDAFSVIVGSYVFYAVISIFSINDEIFGIFYEPLTLFPYLFLFAMLMLALAPSLYMHCNPPNEIIHIDSRLLKPLCWLIVICALVLIPSIVGNFGEGVLKLFTDTDAGKDAYTEQLEGAEDSGSAITNIPAIIFNALYDLGIFFFFYFLTKKEKPLLLLVGLGVAIIIGVLMPIMQGQRTGVINGIYTTLVAYFLFRKYISKAISRLIEISGTVCIILTILPVVALTFSRFDNTNAGVLGYLNWYVGQGSLYFNNYALDAGGIRYGDRTINLVKRLVDSDTPKNFVERRAKYHNLEIDDYYFTTFIGDFCIDFGPILAVIIIVGFNWFVMANIRSRDGTMRLDQLLLIYFTICVCMQGGMYLFAYSDISGNLRMFSLFALYIYLRLHEALLEKFPKTKDNNQ